MRGGRIDNNRSPSDDELRLERRLLPSVAERTRMGVGVVALGSVILFVGDWRTGALDDPWTLFLSLLRLASMAAMFAWLRSGRSDRASSLVALGGVAVLTATMAVVAPRRGDLGPYLLVGAGVALGCAQGLAWKMGYQLATIAILVAGLVADLFFLGDRAWQMTSRASVFAFSMNLLASLMLAVFERRRQEAAASALHRTFAAGDALRDMNERLESLVLDRTAQLADSNRELEATNERLARINRDLEAAWRELEGFTHSVSHDLRVPLRVIHGLSRLVEEESGERLDEKTRGYLARIGEAAIRLGEIGDDLLTLSRVTRTPLSPREVDLSAMVLEVSGRLAAKDAGHVVRVDCPGGLCVRADAALLRVVVEHLVDNARKFTRGRPDPWIRIASEEDNGFSVADNGCGFAPEFAARLFHRFERLHDDSTIEGRGIGLVIVHRIVSRHGGTIRAEGRVGSGATFRLRFPPAPSAGNGSVAA